MRGGGGGRGSLLAGSPVGLESKRFVFEILLARENPGEGTGEEGGFSRAKRISKTNLFGSNPINGRAG